MLTEETQEKRPFQIQPQNAVEMPRGPGDGTINIADYDALLGRFNQTQSAVGVTDLYYSDRGQVVEEDRNSAAQTQYVWSPFYVNQLVERDDQPNSSGTLARRLYVEQDANYNVTSLTDSTGAIVERYTYDPYGTVTVEKPNGTVRGNRTVAASSYGMEYLFQGGRIDPETGLYHFGARDYDPGVGRWEQQDPAGYVNGANRYQTEKSNPERFVDPRGLQAVEDVPPEESGPAPEPPEPEPPEPEPQPQQPEGAPDSGGDAGGTTGAAGATGSSSGEGTGPPAPDDLNNGGTSFGTGGAAPENSDPGTAMPIGPPDGPQLSLNSQTPGASSPDTGEFQLGPSGQQDAQQYQGSGQPAFGLGDGNPGSDAEGPPGFSNPDLGNSNHQNFGVNKCDGYKPKRLDNADRSWHDRGGCHIRRRSKYESGIRQRGTQALHGLEFQSIHGSTRQLGSDTGYDATLFL